MTGRKKIGVFLVVAGALLLVASGLLWRRHAPDLQKFQTQKTALEDSMTRVHAELVKTSLKARALQESQTQIPDTTKVAGAGQMMKLGNEYNKVIRRLEFTERDIKIDIASIDRKVASKRDEARATALPVAAGGAAALLIGIILSALPSRRVGA